MKKNCIKKALAWLLAVLQLLAGTSLAETIIDGVSTFSVSEFTGNYTVRFLDMNGDEVYQVTGVEYAALMDGPFSKLAEAHPEYETVVWSVTGNYRVLNDTDVFMQPENAVAQVGDRVYATLQLAIDAPETVEGSTILLLADAKESINTKGKSFTLNMGGHLLTAVNAGEYAYTQSGGKVLLMQGTITGKDFKGERENPGSGVIVSDNGTLTASYVIIENNKNDYGGGLRASGATVELENCTVTNNSASGDGNGYGGGIYLNGSSTLTGSNLTVSNNSCLYYGGGIYAVDSTLNLESGCVVDNNKNEDGKYGYGAGIYMKGASTLTGKGLTVSNNISKYYGGGIFASGGSINLTEGSSISGNQSEKQSGGGIYMYNGATLTGNKLTVSGNSCLYYGGGIYASGSTLTLENGCVVKGNWNTSTGYGDGGGIYLTGSAALTGSNLTVSNNTAAKRGGGIYSSKSIITLKDNSLFSENKMNSNGGAIYITGGTLTAENTTFEKNNYDGGGSSGGAIYLQTADVELNGCDFLQNKSLKGGAVYLSSNKKMAISDCDFTSNEKTGSSGASGMEISTDYGSVTMKDCVFSENKNGVAFILNKFSKDETTASVTGTKFEGNTGGDYVVYSRKTVFENCEFTGNTSSEATIYTYGNKGDLTFRNCKITGNTVTGTSGAAGISVAMSSTVTLEETTEGTTEVANNEGGESGGILVKAGGTLNVKSGTTVHNNTGNECGGIYNMEGTVNIEEETAVYDNLMGSVANDLRIAANQKIDTIEAAQMKATGKDFTGYYWVDAQNGLPKWLRTDESGNEVFEAVPETLDAERFYTAMPYTAKPVAELLHGNEDAKKYFSLAEAVLAAQDGDTVRLIYSEEKPENNTPVYESVEITGKKITLNLNRRLLNAMSGSAITVRADAELTLTGLPEEAAGAEAAYTQCGTMDKDVPAILNEGTLSIGKGLQTAWVRNQGKLTVGADAKCARVEHLGDTLTVGESAEIERVEQRGGGVTLDTTGKVGTIYLDKDKVVTAGSSFKPEALTFVLDSEVLRLLNKGSVDIDNLVMVPLMAPKDSSVTFDDLLPQDNTGAEDSQKKNKVTVSGASGYTTLKISEDGKLIVCTEPLNGVYVDGQRGIDVEEGVLRGMSPEKPVKTFAKAKEILTGLLSARSIDAQDVKGIYVMGTINVTGAETWDMSDVPGQPENKLLMRYPSYIGSMIQVNGTLTLSNITVDGGSGYGVKANAEMVSVNGVLNIESGAELRNNDRGSGFGGAVCCNSGGNVNLNDGGKVTGSTAGHGGGIAVWQLGKLTMTGGEISGNISNDGGGGVALLVNNNCLSDYTEMMLLKGGKVTGNTSYGTGGGITVGGRVTNLVGKALLTMEGGEVSYNRSSGEGGGIYIQAEAKGDVSCGSITNNTSAGGQFGGGGGIYVNGTRSLDGNTYSTGRLYLWDVIITDNTANGAYGDGGGMAVCNISNTKIYVGNGGAIYGNHCDPSPEIYFDSGKRSGYMAHPDGRVSPYMLGGGEYNWKSPKSGNLVPLDELATVDWEKSLDNDPTNEAIAAARAKAKVWITGNQTLWNSGGGVASNGFVQIGDAPTSGTWTPEATKTLTGRDMKAGEFTFTVWENGTAVSHGKNVAPADGETEARIEFEPISYTNSHMGDKHTYIITEDATALPAVNADPTEFKVEVVLIETKDGKLTGCVASITTTTAEDELDEVAFNNEYKPAKADLKVKKTVTGQKPAKDGTFTFELALQADQTNAQYVVMPQPATVMVTGEGTGTFDSIAFEKAGEYAFTIKEVPGQAKGYKYDGVECQVTVSVTDTDGELSVASISYSKNGEALEGDAAEFENPYTPAPVSLRIPVSKTVQGNAPDSKIFTFELKAATENAPMPETSMLTIIGTGNAEFGAIEYTEPGVWRYTVHELKGNEQYYTYDEQVYTVTVTVTDEDGSLNAAWTTNRGVVENLAFVNSYATPTPTPAPTPTPGPEFTTIRVTKQWQDMDDYEALRPESVTIHLERSVDNGEYEIVDTIELTGEGNTWTHTFQGLPARNDAGVRYQYRVREEEVEGYAVQYDGYNITNVHVVVTPTPEVTPLPTPTNVGPKPERAVGMKYEDGEWIWIDDMGVPLGVVAITGDDDNLTAVLVGMALFLVGACGLIITIARKGKRKKA